MIKRADLEKEHISFVVRSICRERHWTQADFARHTGIGQDVVSAWVRQKVSPSIKMIYKVATALQEDVDRFLLPEGAENVPSQPKKINRSDEPEMSLDFDQPGLAHIELSANIPREAAIRIAEIVNSVTTAKKGRGA